MSEPLTEERLAKIRENVDRYWPGQDWNDAAEDAAALLAEVDRLRAENAEAIDALWSAKWILKKACCLYSIGYNERNAEEWADGKDELDRSAADYRADYDREMADVHLARSKVDVVLDKSYVPPEANQS